eukprot:scaffold197198_cov22-Tisochrysis_lutea.AAC.1
MSATKVLDSIHGLARGSGGQPHAKGLIRYRCLRDTKGMIWIPSWDNDALKCAVSYEVQGMMGLGALASSQQRIQGYKLQGTRHELNPLPLSVPCDPHA